MSMPCLDLSPTALFSSAYIKCHGVELHYTDWGNKDAPVVLMAHGLARTGRDFDELAYALSQDYRVICPDMLGRGLSEWATDTKQYCLNNYALLLAELLKQLEIHSVRWVGTSMGGATGIVAAAGILKERISHLVINDIGPELPAPAITRILNYVGHPPSFKRVTDLEQWLRQVYLPYGWLSDAQWQRMAETSVRRLPSGEVTAHYDPNIVQQFNHFPKDYERWQEFETLALPISILRGKNSDLLTVDTVRKMQKLQPKATIAEFSDCGHAPALNVPEHINFIIKNLKS